MTTQERERINEETKINNTQIDTSKDVPTPVPDSPKIFSNADVSSAQDRVH